MWHTGGRILPKMQETRTQGLIPGSGRCPGGGKAIFSSILAGIIPWTEELGGLQSMRSQMTGHD